MNEMDCCWSYSYWLMIDMFPLIFERKDWELGHLNFCLTKKWELSWYPMHDGFIDDYGTSNQCWHWKISITGVTLAFLSFFSLSFPFFCFLFKIIFLFLSVFLNPFYLCMEMGIIFLWHYKTLFLKQIPFCSVF